MNATKIQEYAQKVLNDYMKSRKDRVFFLRFKEPYKLRFEVRYGNQEIGCWCANAIYANDAQDAINKFNKIKNDYDYVQIRWCYAELEGIYDIVCHNEHLSVTSKKL